jgi:hypothetical protein
MNFGRLVPQVAYAMSAVGSTSALVTFYLCSLHSAHEHITIHMQLHTLQYLTLVKQGGVKLGDTVDIAYPTGNFGNILGAICAQRMGLPLRKIVCAANDNNVVRIKAVTQPIILDYVEKQINRYNL